MEKFISLEAIAAPLMRVNVNTDIIIPIDRLVFLEREELGPYALEPLRYLSPGKENPEFILNRPGYCNARILIAGANFGCGSSREGAVWALERFGIRCLIAPSFGDIFYNNCFKNGVLPIILPNAIVERLAQEAETAGGKKPFLVDLKSERIRTPGGFEIAFAIDAPNRESLLQGLDEIAMTLRYDVEISAFETKNRATRPWIYV